jgi:hypothetical protein
MQPSSSATEELSSWVTKLLSADQQDELRSVVLDWNAKHALDEGARAIAPHAAVDELVGELDQLVTLAVRVGETCSDRALRALCLRIAERCSMDASNVRRQQLFPAMP